MTMKIIIINGPNLNLLGKREPEIYGSQTFEDFFITLQSEFKHIEIEYFQSNIEGELINKLHETGFSYDGIILNAGAYTHTSIDRKSTRLNSSHVRISYAVFCLKKKKKKNKKCNL